MKLFRALSCLALLVPTLALSQGFQIPTPAKQVPYSGTVTDPAGTVPITVTVPTGCAAAQAASAITVTCGSTPPPPKCATAFCLNSVSAATVPVAAGGSITVNASVISTATVSNQTIDVEVLDPQGNKLPNCQNWQVGVNFTANVPVSPTPLACTIPAGSAAGTYSVFVGTFLPAPANTLQWEAKPAMSFAVTGGVIPPPVVGPLDTPAKVLNYLVGLPGTTRRVLTGQHVNYWDANPMDDWTPMQSTFGQTPAILGMGVGIGGSPADALFIAAANTQLAAGGIVQFSIWPGSPTVSPVQGGNSDGPVNFANITVAGTIENKNWSAFITYLAGELKQVKGPVILRLFHEVNGTWFWWGNQNPAQFQALWNYTRAGLIAAGVTNALYEFNINAGVGNYTAYYPGAAAVDIVSEDSYPTGANDPAYAALATLNKPIIIAETGATSQNPAQFPPMSFDNNSILQTTKNSYPKAVADLYWCQGLTLLLQQNGQAVMSDPAVVNLSTLPH